MEDRLNELIAQLSGDMPYNEFERIKMLIIAEIDKLEAQRAGGCQ